MIYAGEITLALEHVHSHDVIFRDLKPENVMVHSTRPNDATTHPSSSLPSVLYPLLAILTTLLPWPRYQAPSSLYGRSKHLNNTSLVSAKYLTRQCYILSLLVSTTLYVPSLSTLQNHSFPGLISLRYYPFPILTAITVSPPRPY